MGSLRDHDFKTSYSKVDSDIANDFFIPCMNSSIHYDRITGYFGSSIYVIIWGALRDFIERGGTIRILCSPYIGTDDRKAIQSGLDSSLSSTEVEQMKNELIKMFNEENTSLHCRLLSCLVATKKVEIKIVTTRFEDIPASHKTMFHDKVGIFYDSEGDVVSFGGSMNETYQGLASDGNSETIGVNISWDIGRDGVRTLEYRDLFESIWNKGVPKIKVCDLPVEIGQMFIDYATGASLPELLDEISITKRDPYWLGDVHLMKHQIRAYERWVSNDRRGIYKHATGSGKTISGLFAIKQSFERKEVPILIVPSIDLQRQWSDEISHYLKDAVCLKCGGDGNPQQWKRALSSWTYSGNGKKIVLAVINTACSDEFISNLTQGDHLFVITDEVHRAGGKIFRNITKIKSGPRLGLSATPERYRDDEGTESIFKYYGKIVDTFTLEDAIRLKILTEYFYYPSRVDLTESESEEWRKITRRIIYMLSKTENTNPFDNDDLMKLIIKRARIIKNAVNKINEAVRIIADNFRSPQKWIVYCDNRRQLEVMKQRLSDQYDVSVYYSGMEGDREATLEYFANHSGILLSIKCLDEGINVPATSHALIIASSQNPREFTQRRGRVLRKSKGKNYSYIYDILVTPPDDMAETDCFSILRSEICRAIKFGEAAINKATCINDLRSYSLECGVDIDSFEDEGYELEDEVEEDE